jgi:cold shock protein
VAALHIKGEETGMAQGTVKWFGSEKGFGSLQPREAARTCSSTSAQSRGSGYRSLDEGKRVEFDITQGQKGPQVENLRVID